MDDDQKAVLDSACQLAAVASGILTRSKTQLTAILELARTTAVGTHSVLLAIEELRARLGQPANQAVSPDILLEIRTTTSAARQAVRDMVKAELQMAALIGREMGAEAPYLSRPLEQSPTSIELKDYLALLLDQIRYLVGNVAASDAEALGNNLDLICRRMEAMVDIAARNVETGFETLTAMELLHVQTLRFIRIIEHADLTL